MKKKTFIVQLLDSKKPSRTSFTQVEDALFYSNDTDASLVFIPHEDTFDFETAKVVMYNRGDESLVERDMEVTTEDGRKVASYELPTEIISHWGGWTAQPVFISGGEIYSGSIVPFSVIRYLMHERPPRLNEVVSVTEFIQESQALVNDMVQEEAQRVSAESIRTSAESQRASAESIRASAEAQRKIDHANRSAELAGKADKVVLENLNLMGNKIQLTSYLKTLRPGTDISDKWEAGDAIYAHRKYNSVKGTGNSAQGRLLISKAAIISNSGIHSGIGVITEPGNTSYIYGNEDSGGNEAYFENLIIINLTQTFGAGNEPTKEEMDRLIEITGYIDGEYALNNKEMLGYLMNGKANKKQEDWLYPTITNGTADEARTPCFFKDEFSVVHLSGRINDIVGTRQTLFTLPTGYRPYASQGFSTIAGGGSFGFASINNAGVASMTAGDTSYMTLDGITFKAER